MDKDNSRNTILFVICAVGMLLLYQVFVMGPAQKRQQAEQKTRAAAAALQPNAAAAGGTVFVDRAQAAAGSPRTAIDTPALQGSLALKGGRIDDLFLKQYRTALPKNSPPVELFRPEGARQAYFADFGWTGRAAAPGPTTLWTQTVGDRLAPGRPVTLAYDNGQGLRFTRVVSVDEGYMFTVTDTVANLGQAPVQLAPYASVQRQGQPELSKTPIIHEGAVGELGDRLQLLPFKTWKEKGVQTFNSTGGWLGVTDKYWLAAVIPDQKTPVTAAYRVSQVGGVDVYEANYVGGAATLQPGQQAVATHRLFAGAKKVSVLKQYERSLGVPRFEDAVDWGHFFFFTKPIFTVLEFFHGLIGNFGVAILLLTVCVKLLFFPLANKSYESITKMKKLQPKMDELKAKYKDDPQKQQVELMELYKREKVNPLAGCLPILIQIPVFYSLYKVLFVTLEMRHAPFFGWIHDLSAPDPTTLFNLFGALPFDPALLPLVGGVFAGPLHIGLWPILMGFSMWLQQAMSPAPSQDPTQKLIFQFFPLIFTFTLAHVSAGLVVYWTWNNTLSILQQYVIMRRFKVDNPIDSAIRKLSGRAATAKSS